MISRYTALEFALKCTQSYKSQVYSLSEMSFSLISQAKMVGFSRLYDSILETTSGVAT